MAKSSCNLLLTKGDFTCVCSEHARTNNAQPSPDVFIGEGAYCGLTSSCVLRVSCLCVSGAGCRGFFCFPDELRRAMQLPLMPQQPTIRNRPPVSHRSHAGAKPSGLPAQGACDVGAQRRRQGGERLAALCWAAHEGLPLQEKRVSEKVLRVLPSCRDVLGKLQVHGLPQHGQSARPRTAAVGILAGCRLCHELRLLCLCRLGNFWQESHRGCVCADSVRRRRARASAACA
jgi:hypothetical protein